MATTINNPSMIDNGHLTFANGPDLYITDVRRSGLTMIGESWESQLRHEDVDGSARVGL